VEQQRRAEAALRAIGPDAVPYLLKLLQQKEPRLKKELREVSWKTKRLMGIDSVYELPWVEPMERSIQLLAAFSALGPAAKPAISTLTDLLHQPDTAYVSACALARIGPEALPPLIRALDSPRPEVRAAAASVLGTVESDTAMILSALRKGLNDPDTHVRIGAVVSLGAIGRSEPQTVLSALITGVGDSNVAVRSYAADALGRLGSEAQPAVPELLKLAEGLDRIASGKARDAIRRIDPEAAAKLEAR
jgi:HEAT repeat protein